MPTNLNVAEENRDAAVNCFDLGLHIADAQKDVMGPENYCSIVAQIVCAKLEVVSMHAPLQFIGDHF